jgi:hypothetical protein
MIKHYRLPIYGTLLSKDPPIGDSDSPVQPISLYDLPNPPEEVLQGKYTDTPFKYNFDEDWCEVEVKADEVVHNWLAGILPQLRGIQKEKGWKLDKSKLEKK